MIVTESTAAVLPLGKDTPKRAPAETSQVQDNAGASVNPGTQGIQRLSSDAAAIVLTQQAPSAANNAPAAAPAKPAATPHLDLHGQDLRSVDLSKLDLRGADLSNADLTGKDLTGIDLSGATLSGAKFDGATFKQASLHGVNATGASFTKATFDYTDLDGGNFAEAKFSGAIFEANHDYAEEFHLEGGSKAYAIKDATFSKADFSGADFRYFTKVEESTFDGAIFDKAHLKTLEIFKGSMAIPASKA